MNKINKKCSIEIQVKEYFVTEHCATVLDDPRRIFNFDEVAIHLHPTVKNVIAAKGAKNIYHVGTGNEKECVTVLLGGNAIGESPPTLIIHKYAERAPRNLMVNLPESIVADKSKSGWMTGETFYDYIVNIFLSWAKSKEIRFPIVVFIDGYASHLTLPMCEFCNANEIILVALLPNATHIYQPMDVGVIYPLKQIWKRKRNEWERTNKTTNFSRLYFAGLLKDCLDELHASDTLFANAFRTCGKGKLIILKFECK